MRPVSGTARGRRSDHRTDCTCRFSKRHSCLRPQETDVLSQPSSRPAQVPVELPGRNSARLPAATTSLAEQRLLHNAVQAQAMAHRQDTERTEDLLSAVTARSTTLAAAIRAIGLPTIPRWHFAMLNDARRNAAF